MHKAGKWLKWQKDYVMSHYANDRIADISIAIGRSEIAISHFASRNGLKKNKDAEFLHRSEVRVGAGTPNFKGYRRKSSKGYIQRYVPWHPCASTNGLVMEHRLVVEGLIGRFLESDESVHHINGNKTDNRPENLELMKFGEHTSLHNKSRKYPPRIKVSYAGSIISGTETCNLLGISAKTVSKWYHELNLKSIEQMKEHMLERGIPIE